MEESSWSGAEVNRVGEEKAAGERYGSAESVDLGL